MKRDIWAAGRAPQTSEPVLTYPNAPPDRDPALSRRGDTSHGDLGGPGVCRRVDLAPQSGGLHDPTVAPHRLRVPTGQGSTAARKDAVMPCGGLGQLLEDDLASATSGDQLRAPPASCAPRQIPRHRQHGCAARRHRSMWSSGASARQHRTRPTHTRSRAQRGWDRGEREQWRRWQTGPVAQASS